MFLPNKWVRTQPGGVLLLPSYDEFMCGADRTWQLLCCRLASSSRENHCLSGCEMELKVRRKGKELSNNRYLLWFVLHQDEERLPMLETAWGKVSIHTNWKIEPCPMTDSKANQSSDTAATVPRQTMQATILAGDTESRPSNENTTLTVGERSSPIDINSSLHSHSSYSPIFRDQFNSAILTSESFSVTLPSVHIQ